MDNTTQEVAQTQPPPVSPKGRSRTIFLIIALMLAVIGLLSVAVLSQNRQQPSPQPTPIVNTSPTPADETVYTEATRSANWKTYTSSEGQFTLQYPSDWSFEDYNEKYPYIASKSPYRGDTVFGNKPFVGHRVFGEIIILTTRALCGVECDNLSESEFFNPNRRQWKIGNRGGGGSGTTAIAVYESSLGGKRAMVEETHPTTIYEGSYPTDRHLIHYVYLGNQAYEVLQVIFVYSDSDPEKDSLVQTFKQILSTFRFEQALTTSKSPTPTCIPRPACLDATPRCLIPEPAEGWCKDKEDNQVVCTQEAKLCPDGSYVGRTGPNCEFAPCP